MALLKEKWVNYMCHLHYEKDENSQNESVGEGDDTPDDDKNGADDAY